MKCYTAKEFAQKIRVSEETIYARVKSGEIEKVPNMGRIIRIPTGELKKFKNVVGKESHVLYNRDKVEIVKTHLGDVRRIIYTGEYVLPDITKCVGLREPWSLTKHIEVDMNNKEFVKILTREDATNLGMYCGGHTGFSTISATGLIKYSKSNRRRIDWDRFLKELKVNECEQVEVKETKVEILNFVGLEVKPKNTIQVLEQREILGQVFKIYGTYENPIFLAKDVAEWIKHTKPSMMLEGIEDEEKLKQTILTSGQNREMWFLTEDGLYEVLMQSRKPIAKEFKKQIKVILKEIRLTGGYVGNSEKFVNNYFLNLSEDVRATIRNELESKNQMLFMEKEKIDKELLDNIKVIKLLDETIKE